MEQLNIQIIDRKRTRFSAGDVRVGKKGYMVFKEGGITKMALKEDDMIVLGAVGGDYYMTHKPLGFFGFRLRRKAQKSQDLIVQSKQVNEIPTAAYNLVKVENNGMTWWKLVKVQ